MYIKRLEILNIRSFESENILLSRGINVISGANNAGKSTILKAMYLLQEQFAFREQDKRLNSDRSDIRITLDQLTQKEKNLFRDYSKGTAELPEGDLVQILFPRSTQPYEGYYAPLELTSHPDLQEVSLQVLREVYTSNFRFFPHAENKGSFIYPFFAKRRSGFMSSSGRDDSFHVFDDFRNLPLKVQKVTNRPVTKKIFEAWCRDILGFEVGIYQGENGESRIGVLVGYNDHIPLESMGEGTANILGLLTLLLTENHKLFLLEELENDIHPEALKKLLPIIIDKSKNNQFVISTHSHIILKYLGSVPETKLFFCQSVIDQQKEGLPSSTITEVSSDPQQRLEVLEKLGYELFDYDLAKGYLIMEESTAEKLVRDYLIPTFIPQLQHVLRTVASQGVNDVTNKLHSLNTLFMYAHRSEMYKNKVWVLVDGDKPGSNVIGKLREKYSSWDPSHFAQLSQPAIEHYYPLRFQSEVIAISKMNNGSAKQEAKIRLLEKVMAWTIEDPQPARQAFKASAEEIINALQAIAAAAAS